MASECEMSVESVSLDTSNKIKNKMDRVGKKNRSILGKIFYLANLRMLGEGRLTRCCMKGSCPGPGGERVSFSPSSIVVLF